VSNPYRTSSSTNEIPPPAPTPPEPSDPRYVRVTKVRDPMSYGAKYAGRHGVIMMTLDELYLVYFGEGQSALYFVDEISRVHLGVVR